MSGVPTTSECVLGRTFEHERLRRPARVGLDATTTLLDGVSLATGARCPDVGCGPGEAMRLMAEPLLIGVHNQRSTESGA